MNTNLIHRSTQKATKWSGGNTTQLSIYPKDSVYSKKDFTYRISTATVEQEESVFTKLEGISRHIMVLEGKLHIIHEDQHEAVLKKYDTDSFDGSWNTTSKGKITDFNLMTSKEVDGNLSKLDLKAEDMYMDDISEEELAIAYYMIKGSAVISIDNEEFELNTGDFIEVNDFDDDQLIQIIASENSKFVIARMS